MDDDEHVSIRERRNGALAHPPIGPHLFTPPAGEPWARCSICGLGEAAHDSVPDPYKPTARRRPEV